MDFTTGRFGQTEIDKVTRLVDTAIPAGGTDFLPENIEGSVLSYRGTLRIKISLDTATTFSINEKIGGTDHVMTFNEGGDLNANAVYVFDYPIRTDANYNFQLGAMATINILQIDFCAGKFV